MNAGDIVEIINVGSRFFSVGDIATLKECDGGGDWWADFNGHKNTNVYTDGIWCVGAEDDNFFKLKGN